MQRLVFSSFQPKALGLQAYLLARFCPPLPACLLVLFLRHIFLRVGGESGAELPQLGSLLGGTSPFSSLPFLFLKKTKNPLKKPVSLPIYLLLQGRALKLVKRERVGALLLRGESSQMSRAREPLPPGPEGPAHAAPAENSFLISLPRGKLPERFFCKKKKKIQLRRCNLAWEAAGWGWWDKKKKKSYVTLLPSPVFTSVFHMFPERDGCSLCLLSWPSVYCSF